MTSRANLKAANGRQAKAIRNIHTEIIRRKFSARQYNIVIFILTLSLRCGKKAVIIPKLRDFAICGIGQTNIKRELLGLEQADVLIWERTQQTFQINESVDAWKIPIASGWNEDRFTELIIKNSIRGSATGRGLMRYDRKQDGQ